MNWEKGNFLITVNEDNKVFRRFVSGIVTKIEDFGIGIHKAGGWVVTDISTGYQIRMCETQKQAKAWVEENCDKINKMLSKPEHAKHVDIVSGYSVEES